MIEADRLAVILDCADVIALVPVNIAAIEIGNPKFRIEADCLVEIPDGAVVIAALVGVGAAAIVIAVAFFGSRRIASANSLMARS